MATVSSTLKMFDAMSGPLRNITNSMNLMIGAMQRMQNATNRNVDVDRALIAAQREIASAEADITSQINGATRAQDEFNNAVENGKPPMDALGFAIIAINQGLQLAEQIADKVMRAMAFSDEVASTNVRLGRVNDNLQTQLQLQDKVMASAERARGSYLATAKLIARLGTSTKGVFKNTQGIIDFAERFNKILVAGGASAADRESAVLQMAQALGAGKLQGDEFKAIAEAAPDIMDVISRGTGIGVTSLGKFAEEGKLTSDKVVKAFEKQSDFIDGRFNQMPKTFGDAMTSIQNRITKWVDSLHRSD